MIPRVIHYCWFGQQPKPAIFKQCLSSWEKYLPDYKIIEWNEDNYQIKHQFAKDAYNQKKWAFVADYARFDILYNYGGIYLDTDMLLLKNLDFFLENECFLGFENETLINCAIIGSKKNSSFIKKVLVNYNNISFSKNQIPVTYTLTGLINLKRDNVKIYSNEVFYPFPFECKEESFWNYITEDSYAVHLWNLSWVDEWQQFQMGFRKTGLKLALQKIRQFPIQSFSYYYKILKAIMPSYIKKPLRFLFLIFIKLGLKIPYIDTAIIHSKKITYQFRYSQFPQPENFKLPSFKKVNRYGIYYNLNIAEHNGWRVYFNIFSQGTQKLFSLIKSNFNIIDVGANIGYYSLNFSKRAFNGKILAFEPFPYNFNQLKHNTLLNNHDNIEIYNIALGNTISKIDFERIDERNLGMVQIKEKSKLPSKIDIVPLDNFLSKMKSSIDLIKIDIEGYEMNFLLGAKKTIETYYPILFIEISDDNLKKFHSSAKELISFLENLGYDLIFNADTDAPVRSFHNLENCFIDVICQKSINNTKI